MTINQETVEKTNAGKEISQKVEVNNLDSDLVEQLERMEGGSVATSSGKNRSPLVDLFNGNVPFRLEQRNCSGASKQQRRGLEQSRAEYDHFPLFRIAIELDKEAKRDGTTRTNRKAKER